MTAIWTQQDTAWRLLPPAGFPDEQTLHRLVEEAPQLLPLSGSPGLLIVGREVQLGTGYADLLAVEPSGRVAIIEVKLAKNAEARRAVVAQVLAYAAYLDGMSYENFDSVLLAPHLQKAGRSSLVDAAAEAAQGSAFDAAAFRSTLADNLAAGRFRLVFVLDEVPAELTRLVAYLEGIGDQLVIDLITVSAYQVGDQRIVVPRRVQPERKPAAVAATGGAAQVAEFPGSQAFLDAYASTPEPQLSELRRLCTWADSLASGGLAQLVTVKAKVLWALKPTLADEGVGLVTIYNDSGPSLQFWRSVFERRAPRSIERVEAVLEKPIANGNQTRVFSDQLLAELTAAYREAGATGVLTTPKVLESNGVPEAR